jgi:hypothetical protein
MADKRMMILPAELVKKIDDNRGDMSQADFIDYLINSQMKEEQPRETKRYVTEEQFRSFEQDVKKLLRSFLDFFINYDLELGKSPRNELEELVSRLQGGLEKDLDSSDNEKKATIKWK